METWPGAEPASPRARTPAPGTSLRRLLPARGWRRCGGGSATPATSPREVQRRQQPRLAFKPRTSIGVFQIGLVQQLDGDLPAQPGVGRLIDDAHATGAKLRRQPVMSKDLLGHAIPPRSFRIQPGSSILARPDQANGAIGFVGLLHKTPRKSIMR